MEKSKLEESDLFPRQRQSQRLLILMTQSHPVLRQVMMKKREKKSSLKLMTFHLMRVKKL